MLPAIASFAVTSPSDKTVPSFHRSMRTLSPTVGASAPFVSSTVVANTCLSVSSRSWKKGSVFFMTISP